MSQRDAAIKSIRHSLNQVRYRPYGDDRHMTGIQFGTAIGKISLAHTAGLISSPEKGLLDDLTFNAADQAAACQRKREANHA